VSSSTYEEDERGVGWLLFAATMLGLAGILTVIDGIVALSRSKFFVGSQVFVFSDLRTWGWLMLLVGALLILAAMGVFAGSGFSRWFGIFAASIGMIGHFSAMNMYPFWSLIVITCCILVIYGLAAYGGKRGPAGA
jgi:hypothetical protein